MFIDMVFVPRLSCLSQGMDPRSQEGIKTLQIYRQKYEAELSLLSRVENTRGTYTDSRAVAGETYIYMVTAEMNDGRVVRVNDGVVAYFR